MNTYFTLAWLLAVLGACYSNPVGIGGYGLGYGGIIAPAISTANLYKAAPISVIRTAAVAPIIAPAVSTVPVLRTVGVGGYGLGGYGYGLGGWGGYGLGGYGLGGWGGHGYGGYGLGGWGGHGLGGKGLGLGGYGLGLGGKIIG